MSHKRALSQAFDHLRIRVEEMLKFYIDLLSDLNRDGIASVNLSKLNMAASAIRAFDPKKLFDSFSKTNEHWINIKSRDPETLEKVLRSAYDSGIIDVSLFMIPFDCLEKVSKDPQYRGLEQDDWPITEQDIEVIWEYLEAIVKICVKIIHIRRRPSTDSEPFEYRRSYFDGINVAKLARDLNFSLDI